jgi:ABC-type bacteriocin/lantibiotic exporter with double-glycine peptidase domain
LKSSKTTFWQKFTFSDVTPFLKNLRKRPAERKDLNSISFINETLAQKDPYPEFQDSLHELRKSPIQFIIKSEKTMLFKMFKIHISDVILSLISSILAIQILRSFESPSENFRLIELFYHEANTNQTIVFTGMLAIFIFLINLVSSSLHAQKIEKEMLLSWRIPYKIIQYMYVHLLLICKSDRSKFQAGDITNLAQNDAKYIGNFLSHAFVDFPVLITSCILVMLIMLLILGKVAWIGLFIICLQIPLSIFFTWLGNKLHTEMMSRGDKRLHLISEWIKGMRLIRYFGWGNQFKHEIKNTSLSEFKQDLKITVKYCVAFSLTHSWWMVVSSGIFAGIVYYNNSDKSSSSIFAAIWLSGILGQQITPLPWFVNAWSQAISGSNRLKKFYKLRTQLEEFKPDKKNDQILNTQREFLQIILKNQHKYKIFVGFKLENVSHQFSPNEPMVINDINLDINPGKTLAIVGPVACGKSLLIQIIMGDITPKFGKVSLLLKVTDKNNKEYLFQENVHSEFGLEILRSIQAYVPQDAFIMSSTIRENIPLTYQNNLSDFNNDKDIMNSLYAASFYDDLKNFSSGLDTEIGEHGINLSGGQKQRISLSRSAFAKSLVIFLDDPFSAVDVVTENNLVHNIFKTEWGIKKTIIWSTHRLNYLKNSDFIIYMEKGKIIEYDSYNSLFSNKKSKFNQYILGKIQDEK